MRKAIVVALVGAVILLTAGLSAEAGGRHGRGGVSLGVHIGGPVVGFSYGYGWGGGWRHHYPYWGPRYSWYWGAPYYVYSPPTVVVEQPPVYVQQEPSQAPEQYWYYCEPSRAYYPYVKECPTTWLKVVPQAPPSEPGSPTR
ncbi:MAG TPA: hypothetical protein VLI67_07195 [Vicinamibacteria bacterium]|nr:hypothetical protein [Vicinamibacteria bacterium]